jgi:speckle-type POZ protein
LEYLYTDTVREISLDMGIHLLIVSERFMLDRLKALCEDFIRRDVNVDNAIGILVASHQHNASGLKDIALDFILKNLNEPVIMQGLSELKSEPDLLVEIIKRNSTGQAPPAAAQMEQHPPGGPFGPGSDWGARR